jgi:hypothetical protein
MYSRILPNSRDDARHVMLSQVVPPYGLGIFEWPIPGRRAASNSRSLAM